MKLKFWLALFSLLFVLPALAIQDDGSPEAGKSAFLNVAYGPQGDATVDLSLAQQPASWTGIQQALSRTMNCAADDLRHPDTNAASSRYLNRLSASDLQKRLQEIADRNALQLRGECSHSAQRSGLAFSGTIDTTSLVSELRAAGVDQLGLSVEVPEYPYVAFTGAPKSRQTPMDALLGKFEGQSTYVPIPIIEGARGPIVGVAFGWSKAIVMRTAIRMTVFLFLPVAILMRVRTLSLKTFKDDPTGAWFAYMKTLGWCTNGGMLLWYLTNIGARKDVESLLNFMLSRGRNLTAVNLAVYFIPSAFIYLSCIAISHRVFVDVKKAQYTWAQFLIEHSLTLAKTIVPIACASAAIGFYSQPRLFAGLILAAYASAILLGRWRMKLTKNYPKIVLAGELRDRIFAFAKSLGVKLQQVIILPAHRMQVANAFASPANTVIFTDFLLERMSKREVDAIAGHELTHLKRSHPAKLGLAMIAACFAPLWVLGIFGVLAGVALGLLFRFGIKISPVALADCYRIVATLSDWGIDGAIAVALAFALVYALSRRFERQADAGAVALTKDPEAMITALLKLNSLNLMPLSWDKGTSASLTHPSTLQRIQRIANTAGIPNPQLEQLIAQFSIDKLTHTEVTAVAEQHNAGERYATQSGEPGVSHKTVARTQNTLFILIALLVIPPALVEFAVEHLHIVGQFRSVVQGIGIVLTAAVYLLAVKMLGLHGLAKRNAQRRDAIEKSGIKIKDLKSCMVAFSPGAAPRIYVGNYNFDTGALILSKDRLTYLGRQLKFSLTRRQVLSIQTGPGIPGWWRQDRIYIRWQDDASGKDGVFSVCGQEPCSVWQLDARVRELYSKLLNWRLRGEPQQIPPELEALPIPQIGEVTCKTPRETLGIKVQFTVLLIAGAAIWGVSSLAGISSGYLWMSVIVLRIFEIVPYLFYREPKQQQSPATVLTKTASATASF